VQQVSHDSNVTTHAEIAAWQKLDALTCGRHRFERLATVGEVPAHPDIVYAQVGRGALLRGCVAG